MSAVEVLARISVGQGKLSIETQNLFNEELSGAQQRGTARAIYFGSRRHTRRAAVYLQLYR
jgi:hypothetical protein